MASNCRKQASEIDPGDTTTSHFRPNTGDDLKDAQSHDGISDQSTQSWTDLKDLPSTREIIDTISESTKKNNSPRKLCNYIPHEMGTWSETENLPSTKELIEGDVDIFDTTNQEIRDASQIWKQGNLDQVEITEEVCSEESELESHHEEMDASELDQNNKARIRKRNSISDSQSEAEENEILRKKSKQNTQFNIKNSNWPSLNNKKRGHKNRHRVPEPATPRTENQELTSNIPTHSITVPTNSTTKSYGKGNTIILSAHGENAQSFCYSPVAIYRGLQQPPFNTVVPKDVRFNRRRNIVTLELFDDDSHKIDEILSATKLGKFNISSKRPLSDTIAMLWSHWTNRARNI